MAETNALNDLPFIRNAEIYYGDAYRAGYAVSLQTDDGTAALSWATAAMTLTITDGVGGATLLSGGHISGYTGSSGIYRADGAVNYFTVWVKAADGTTLGVGTYYYEVVAALSSADAALPNITKRILAGTFEIKEGAAEPLAPEE